jgi:hypothetical protein
MRIPAGTRQSNRLPPPLSDGFLRVEDRDLAARLALLGDLARQIAFVDPGNRVSGTWEKLFQNEPVFLLAELVSLSVEEAELSFAASLARDWRAGADEVVRLARRVSVWLDRLAALPESPFLRQIQMLDAKDDLSTKLRVLAAPSGALRMGRLLDADRGAKPAESSSDPVARAREDLARLRGAHAMLLNVVTALRPTSVRSLAEQVRSRRIDPALGLLIAEMRAADLVAERINALPERLIRFYYEDILGQHRRGLPPERLLFRLPPTPAPVHLPKGAGIEGRISERIWRFETETPIQVIPARVVGQAMLRYDTDSRISLFTSFAAITGIRAQAFRGETWPSPRQVFSPDPTTPVAIGLEIASPMLWLAEGKRQIEIELDLERRAGISVDGNVRVSLADLELALRDDPELVYAMGFRDLAAGVRIIADRVATWSTRTGQLVSIALLHEVLAHDVLTLAGLRVLLGRIVSAILIEREPWPSGAFWDVLREKIVKAGAGLSGQRLIEGDDEPQSLIAEAFRRLGGQEGFLYAPEDVFEMLLGDAFAVSLSIPGGFHAPPVCRVRRNAEGRPAGITFQISLDQDAPPLAAPGGAQAPLVRILASPLARICPVSFFERFRLVKTLIRVRVDGLRGLVGFSDDGRLDLSKSFAPFGARPGDGARFLVAAPEMALKPVSDVTVDIDWAELPGNGAGFATHYARYPPAARLPEPHLSAEYLSADGWKPLADALVPMFAARPGEETLAAGFKFRGTVLGNSIPDTAAAPPPPAIARGQLVAGAIRFTLSGSSDGFLAEEYPGALVRAMRPRLFDWPRRVMPRPAFVPRVRALALGYTASKVISVNDPVSARPGERITQITPFGRRTVFPRERGGEVSIFPMRLGYGAHFVQIDGPGALGPVSLLFEVAKSAHHRLPGPRIPLSWYYLAPAGWERLPDTALASDTTDGLMRSGVVAVDLPDDALHQSDEMPGAGYWLAAVARSPDIDRFPVLRRVQTNGVWAVRVDGPETLPDQPRRFVFAPGRPGVPVPAEVASDHPLQEPEALDGFKTRVSEGLQHRQRAITPWDVERLVLEAFPEVWMVACLPCLDAVRGQLAAGYLTVVVVPHPPQLSPGEAPVARLFDPILLRRIEGYLHARAPREARIRVRNPGYEILQLRGRVRFDASGAEGALAQRLRQDMVRHLTVWTAPPAFGRFGWSLNIGSLHAEMEALPYVERVTEFSVLHLVSDDGGNHVLHDTATHDPKAGGEIRLRAAEPWGLPLSAADHILTSTTDPAPRDARPTGIGGLRLGEMLIVNQRART